MSYPKPAEPISSERRCGCKTEVYSRVCGYFRPVANWSAGKREEFKDRRTFDLDKGRAGAILEKSRTPVKLKLERHEDTGGLAKAV